MEFKKGNSTFSMSVMGVIAGATLLASLGDNIRKVLLGKLKK